MNDTPIARPLPFAFAFATAALLAACGGGGGGTSSPPTGGGGQNCMNGPYGTTCTPTGTTFGGAGGGNYVANALVSDTSATQALHHDTHLVNAWGLAFNPQGFSWIANAGTGSSTLYDGSGVPQSLVVTLNQGAPSGIVFNGTTDFSITENGVSGAAPFVFATLQGQISAWAPTVDGTHSFTIVDNSSSGAVYTGLAINTGTGGDMLYAANFTKGKVDVFSGTFSPLTTAGGFTDPTLPAGYAPFGIQQIGGKVYVAYAQPDPVTHEKVGAGLGLVDVFDLQGNLTQHLVGAGGALNAPWGLAMAPANFGKFSNMLLVGNFGDGKINVYDPATGALAGTVSNNDGSAIVTPGLWALQFGNGLNSQPTNTLFYTAGPVNEQHGLYGRIDMN
ncbi:MAG: TIGR03118 family protein [Burkholderiales bacterium]|nr:TIGR03118 family protein [Burkholderiales bacterium]